NFLRATPGFTVHLTPVPEVAGQKSAERTRFGAQEFLVEGVQADLLRLQPGPTRAGLRQRDELLSVAWQRRVVCRVDDHYPVGKTDGLLRIGVELDLAQCWECTGGGGDVEPEKARFHRS